MVFTFPLIFVAATLFATASIGATRDQAIGLLMHELKSAGANHITISELAAGKTVIQASYGNTATVISLDPSTYEIDYLETFDRNAPDGFFGRRSAPNEQITRALERYTAALAANETPANQGDNLGGFLLDEREIRTLGFSNERTITTDAKGAEIRTDTRLGVPEFRTQNLETSFNSGGVSNNSVSFTAEFNLNQTVSITTLSGVSSFDQQVFTNPDGFRDGLSVTPPTPGVIIPAAPDASSIRANISNSVTTSFQNFPSLAPPNFAVSE